MDLRDKKVIVTGGVRGLGRQTVEKLVSKGAAVTLVSQRGDGWSQVKDGDITGYMRSSVLGAEPPR